MEQEALKKKAMELMQPCGCGSGKKAFMCCSAGEAKAIENETCICGSGKMLKDCCMKSPETHEKM